MDYYGQNACYKNKNHTEIVWFTGELVLVIVEKVVYPLILLDTKSNILFYICNLYTVL